MSHHLYHIDDNREEAMEGLLALLYDKFDGLFSRPDMVRIFIALGGDAGSQYASLSSSLSLIQSLWSEEEALNSPES